MSFLLYKNWFEKNRKEIRDDYFRFLRFSSISADPSCKGEVRACAEWVLHYINDKTGLKAELIETEGYPLIIADAGRSGKTLCIYGHYDVQPVDPIEQWKTPPFEPTEIDGKIYARGAVDDKGQIFFAMVAARAVHELGLQLPINLKFCIEGEEESTSVGLSKSLPLLREKLSCEDLLVVDFPQFDEGVPAVSLGARGIITLEVVLRGANTDLHSGAHGGIAYNPNKALVQLLAKLWDAQGRVVVPHFYEDVIALSEAEKMRYDFPYNRERYSKEFDVHAFGGERGLSIAENNLFQPTLEINGIGGGYVGEGFKTVIPKTACAKISVRLVPGQDPRKIGALLADFLKNEVEPGMEIEVTDLGGEPAFRGDPDSALARAVAKASETAMGKPAKNILSGASIPIIAKMVHELKCSVVGMGYCLPGDNIHAPNEHFDWDRFEKGFLTVSGVLEAL